MIKINEDFKSLIPALTADEFKQLEDNCMAEGIREKILTWNGFIIDGHNRYEISQKWDLDYQTESKHFKDEEDVKEWMILNQLGRRNVTKEQRAYLIGKRYENEKQRVGGQVPKGGAHFGPPVKTAEKLAEELNISKNQVKRNEHFAQGVDKLGDELKQVVLQGKANVNKADIQTIAKAEPTFVATTEAEILAKAKEIKQQKAQEKKANFEAKKELFEAEIKPENIEQIIILGNSIEVLPTLKPKSFDLLLSDPPYGMDFKSGWSKKDKIANDKIIDTVSLFENVLKESVPLLKDDAHFYLFGNINFIGEIRPIIEKYLNLKNILIWDRKVIGMGDLKSYGNSYDIIYFGYNKVWKELNGTRDRDLLSYSRIDPSKNIHPTEKPLDILQYLIKKSSNENESILEPFAGGGSTLLACKNLNRKATGIEIEEKYYNLIKERI